MKTDELISLLAKDAGVIDPVEARRRYNFTLVAGALASALLMFATLGARTDIAQAAAQPMFWMKLAFPAVLAVGAVVGTNRLGRPGVRLGLMPGFIIVPLVAIWLSAAWVVGSAPPDERAALLLGNSWAVCSLFIALMSVPMFLATLLAMRGLAPTRPAIAGAAAGLVAGAVGATVYALHCTEMQVPFLAVWYVIGMAIPAIAGGMIGRRLLRW